MRGGTPAKTAGTSELLQTLRGLTTRLGTEFQSAGAVLKRAAPHLALLGPSVALLGAAHQGFGHRLLSASSATLGDAGAVETQARSLVKEHDLLVQRLVAARLATLEEHVGSVREAARATRAGLSSYVEGVSKSVDIKDNIAKLGKGDSYVLNVFGYLGVTGVRLTGSGGVGVLRDDAGTYTVSADGELGAGLFAEAGGRLGNAAASLYGAAHLAAGGLSEFKFSTPAEATRAARIITSPTKRSSADLQWLLQRQAAVELRGSAALTAWGILGLKQHPGLLVSGDAKAQLSLRVESGTPPMLVVKQTTEAALEAQTVADLPFVFMSLAGGTATARVAAEQRYELPPGIQFSRVVADPTAAMKTIAAKLKDQRSVESVSFSLLGDTGVMGNGRGGTAQLNVKASLGEVARSGALTKALRGDWQGALAALPPSTLVEGTAAPFFLSGVRTGPWVSIMGVGAAVELDATRQDVDEHRVRRTLGPARRAAAELLGAP